MATSGSKDFNLTVADVLDEAWERCGKDPASIASRHIHSALRSLNLLQVEMENRPGVLWLRDHITLSLTPGNRAYALPTGSLEVFEVQVNETAVASASDLPVTRISPHQWTEYPDKALTGRPSVFYVDHQSPVASDLFPEVAGQSPPVIVFWPVPEKAYTATIYRYRQSDDADAISNDIDLRRVYFEAVCAGLASKLSIKWAPDRYTMLTGEFEKQMALATASDSRNNEVIIAHSFRNTRRRRM